METGIVVMTYNIRSCRGPDGIVSHQRIVDIIAEHDPDIIALQEVDVGLKRSNFVDQAEAIATGLSMHYHFHPSFGWEEGEYGNVILSKHPMTLIRAEGLPTINCRRPIERRGAVWVEIALDGLKLQVITTHLGLKRRERMLQAEILCGDDWLDNPRCGIPVIVCGDFNAGPLSGVYRMFRGRLNDAQRSGTSGRPSNTWPARIPLSRIDHIFHSSDIRIRESMVIRNDSVLGASDHLPLFANMTFSSKARGGSS